MYEAVHGGEDEKNALNPVEQESIVNNFNKMYNQ